MNTVIQECEKVEINIMANSSSHEVRFGADRLCYDIATLINNPQGSDVQFKVGGGISTQENGETVYDESTTVTLYAHSLILRCRSSYFATMLDKNKDWEEKSKLIIYKPNISPTTFQDVLHYIYTGNVQAKNSDNIIELITVADEMNLEELSTKCQSVFMRTVKNVFSDEDEGSAMKRIPIDVAIRTHIIPALDLASSYSLSHLSQELLTIMLPCMSVIVKSPDAYTSFINEISSESLVKIIASDDLAMTERNIWDLTLNWACHQTKLSKTAVEVRLNNFDDDEDDGKSSDDTTTIINNTQLKQLKKILTPLLAAIRFSLLDPDDYRHMVNTLVYILPRRRYMEINQFFLNPGSMELLDAPRKQFAKRKPRSKLVIESKIVVEPTTWELLRKNIFEADGIPGCLSSDDLKFELLFRASDHGFLASTFHQRCDYKGPTLVIARSADGHLFGGVNFNHWESDNSYSSSVLNFLFALPDGHHRKDSAIFKIKDRNTAKYSSQNIFDWGPRFGGRSDLAIANSAGTNDNSYSGLPKSYNGSGASDTALAGSRKFTVSDYEVYAILE